MFPNIDMYAAGADAEIILGVFIRDPGYVFSSEYVGDQFPNSLCQPQTSEAKASI